MRVILLGPPGSGKGTQGELIEKKYGFPKISTGDLLRQAVTEGTPDGRKAEAIMSQGRLVDDELVIEMVGERIARPDCGKGYTLDGFPRNIFQARSLRKIDPKRREVAIEIQLDERVLIERLSSRRICSRCQAIYNFFQQALPGGKTCRVCGGQLNQRKDDRPEAIRERLRVYREQTQALSGYYRERKVYHRIEGEAEVGEVFKKISSILDQEIAQKGETGARP